MTKILVVDRIQSVREALAFVLELEGHDVRHVASGREALALAAAEPFDVVLADAQMRDRPFDAFCRALRTVAPQARIVVMSLDITDGPATAPCAPAAFLPKPFPAPVLLDAVALAA
jgi:two-component system response regulator FlrC